MNSHIKLLIAGAVSAVAAACSLTTDPGVSHIGTGPRRILFVGNSLTAANSMPAMVVALAESAKVSPLPSVDVDWYPNYALVDHISTGEPQSIIPNGHYDVVVLQQGPSSVEVNRDTLRLATKAFAPLIRSGGGIPALLSVWPTIDRQVDWDRATESYRLAAQDVQGMLFPGGEVWRAAWRRDPSLAFYSQDGLHPSSLGSYAVALSIVGMLYDRSPVGLATKFRTADGSAFTFDPSVGLLVQQAAEEANRTYGSKGTR